jgi:hypothetical protein
MSDLDTPLVMFFQSTILLPAFERDETYSPDDPVWVKSPGEMWGNDEDSSEDEIEDNEMPTSAKPPREFLGFGYIGNTVRYSLCLANDFPELFVHHHGISPEDIMRS